MSELRLCNKGALLCFSGEEDDLKTDRQTDRQKDGQTDGRTDRRTDGRTDGQTDSYQSDCDTAQLSVSAAVDIMTYNVSLLYPWHVSQ